MPVLILVTFWLLDSGRYLMMRQSLTNAVREGARLAIVSGDSLATADIQSAVTARLAPGLFPNLAITVYQVDPATGANLGAWNNAAQGEFIAVQATATYTPLMPILPSLTGPIAMNATCIMSSETN
jgi:Flp pilus assembly protein TadG